MLGYDWPRLHAALNDLPTALLLTAVLFDVLAAITKRPGFRQVSFWTLMVGAVGGAAAVISGLQAEGHIEHGEAVHELMETHEKLALITLGVFAVLALWRIFRERRMSSGERTLVLLLSLGGLGILFATANYGGRMVFDHAAAIPSKVMQQELLERSEGHHHHGAEAEDHHEGEADEHEHGSTATDSATQPLPNAAHPEGTPSHTHPPGTPPHEE
jgi:uncharacterized membrane protein